MNDMRTMRRELPSSLSRPALVSLLVLSLAPSFAWAADGGPVVKVQVDASIDRADQVRERITTDAEKVLREHDVATTVDPEEPRSLTIAIGGERYDYAIELVVERAGKADAPTQLRCECNYDELFAKVSEGVRDSVPALQKASDEAPPAADPPAAKVQPETPPLVPDQHGPAPLGAMGKAGIATLVVGVAGLATGIALVVVGDQTDDDGGLEGDASGTDFRPAGYAMLAVGGAALVTGAVLLGVDRARARKRATALSPWFGPRSAGVTFSARF